MIPAKVCVTGPYAVRTSVMRPWTGTEKKRVVDLIANCRFEHLRFDITWETIEYPDGSADITMGCYLQVCQPNGVCRDTGEPWKWRSRKWRISRHMTDSEIVRTAWLCGEIAMRHEHMESFAFCGSRVFDPHVGVDTLAMVTTPDNRDDRPPVDPMGEAVARTGEIG